MSTVGGVPVEGAICYFTGSVHRNKVASGGYQGGKCTSTKAWFLRRDWSTVSGSDVLRDGMTIEGRALSGDSGGAMMFPLSATGKMAICGITANAFGDEVYFTKAQNIYADYPQLYPITVAFSGTTASPVDLARLISPNP